MRAIRTTSLAGASLLALTLAGQAFAADAPASTEVQEVVVTAQKREQSVLDVPIALTAYSGETLEALGLSEFEELGQFVPGFDVQNQSPNNPGFVMRGITSDSGEATTEPRVSVYQDGVSISKSRGSYVELFDLERVEIAKGPQSTLYGRGALIGAVNIIQAKARHEAGASLKIEGGDNGYALIEGVVNVPISDALAVRVAARSKKRDGYVENLLGGEDFNSTDTQAVRVAIAYDPGDRFKLDVLYNYQQDKPSGTSFKSLTYAPTDPTTGRVIGDLGRNSGAALSSVDGFENGQELGLNRRLWSLTALASYKLNDAFTLNSTSAYRYFTGEEVFDPDGFSLPMLTFAEDAQGKSASQEFRLNYDAGGRVTAFGGASWFWEDGSQRVPMLINEKIAGLFLSGALPRPGGLSLPVINAVAPAALPSARREEYTNYGETNSYDVFGDVTFKATDRLELTAGARYTYDDKTSGYGATMSSPSIIILSQTGTQRGLIVQPTLNGQAQYQDFTDNGVTYRLVARYKAADNTSLYGSVSTGRRPKVLAGSNGTPGAAATFREVAAEEVTSYEAGAKTALLDRRLTLEGAIYRYDYENFQTSQRDSNGQTIPLNAGEAKATGFEGQANFQATKNLLVFATYGYSHARFGNGLFDGNHFRLSPDHQASIGVKASVDTGVGRFTLIPTYTWQSEMFFDNNNDIAALQTTTGVIKDTVQDEKQKAYGLLNLRLTWQPENSPLTFGAFATNVLEQKYIKDAGNTGDAFGIPTFIAGEPRFVGVSVSIKR
ncbi:TonB-dependent receptor [Caulobacter flavus]|uniref:TonB-dependent receptor n=1 Tax=Caulobacter flavus TaxID=1679497 RepID=A0A2N5D5S8_9CAUL|nr:TonB-dependent receptor [Caulobacter flavus]AYV46037.1 TonB-dependent receptor [Caulobacter flavus]PLR21420.1 TonB-dependent receptor [Caulobacter flavus]